MPSAYRRRLLKPSPVRRGLQPAQTRTVNMLNCCPPCRSPRLLVHCLVVTPRAHVQFTRLRQDFKQLFQQRNTNLWKQSAGGSGRHQVQRIKQEQNSREKEPAGVLAAFVYLACVYFCQIAGSESIWMKIPPTTERA